MSSKVSQARMSDTSILIAIGQASLAGCICLAVAGYLFLVGFFQVNGFPAFHEVTGVILSTVDLGLGNVQSIVEGSTKYGLHPSIVEYPGLGLLAGAALGTSVALALAWVFQKAGLVPANE